MPTTIHPFPSLTLGNGDPAEQARSASAPWGREGTAGTLQGPSFSEALLRATGASEAPQGQRMVRPDFQPAVAKSEGRDRLSESLLSRHEARKGPRRHAPSRGTIDTGPVSGEPRPGAGPGTTEGQALAVPAAAVSLETGSLSPGEQPGAGAASPHRAAGEPLSPVAGPLAVPGELGQASPVSGLSDALSAGPGAMLPGMHSAPGLGREFSRSVPTSASSGAGSPAGNAHSLGEMDLSPAILSPQGVARKDEGVHVINEQGIPGPPWKQATPAAQFRFRPSNGTPAAPGAVAWEGPKGLIPEGSAVAAALGRARGGGATRSAVASLDTWRQEGSPRVWLEMVGEGKSHGSSPRVINEAHSQSSDAHAHGTELPLPFSQPEGEMLSGPGPQPGEWPGGSQEDLVLETVLARSPVTEERPAGQGGGIPSPYLETQERAVPASLLRDGKGGDPGDAAGSEAAKLEPTVAGKPGALEGPGFWSSLGPGRVEGSASWRTGSGGSGVGPLGVRVAEQVGEDIVRIALPLRDGQAREAILQLEPESLGRLWVRLSVERGQVQLHVATEHQGTGALLTSHLSWLRESLEQYGLRLDQVRVDSGLLSGDGAAGFSFLGHDGSGGVDNPFSWDAGRGQALLPASSEDGDSGSLYSSGEEGWVLDGSRVNVRV